MLNVFCYFFAIILLGNVSANKAENITSSREQGNRTIALHLPENCTIIEIQKIAQCYGVYFARLGLDHFPRYAEFQALPLPSHYDLVNCTSRVPMHCLTFEVYQAIGRISIGEANQFAMERLKLGYTCRLVVNLEERICLSKDIAAMDMCLIKHINADSCESLKTALDMCVRNSSGQCVLSLEATCILATNYIMVLQTNFKWLADCNYDCVQRINAARSSASTKLETTFLIILTVSILVKLFS